MTFFFISIFMFLVFWRPQEWLLPFLYGMPLLDIVFVAALAALLLESKEGTVRVPRGAPQLYLISGLFFAALMSHAAHTYFAGMKDTFLPSLKICTFTLVLFIVLDRTSRLLIVARLFLFMAATMALHALLQQRTGFGLGGQRAFFVGTGFRSVFYGIFEDPNDLAQMLAGSIPFAFALTRRHNPLSIAFGIGVSVLLVMGTLATGSRGGLVGLAAGIAVMFVLWLPARWMPWCLGALAVGFILACPLAGGILDESAHDRVVFWGTANWYFKRNPLFGVGSMMMSEYMPKGRSIHSAYVSCYTELGLFGYWFWFGLIQLGILGAWRARRALRVPTTVNQVWLRRFAGLAVASMCSFGASGYFLARAFIYPLFFLFATLGAIPVVAQKLLGPEEIRVAMRRQDARAVTWGTFISVGYIYMTIILLNKVWYQ
jgi:hypothetical protein